MAKETLKIHKKELQKGIKTNGCIAQFRNKNALLYDTKHLWGRPVVIWPSLHLSPKIIPDTQWELHI